MKLIFKYLSIIVSFSIIVSCQGQTTSDENKTKKLSSYDELKNIVSSCDTIVTPEKCFTLFFEKFPDDFSSFDLAYGFDEQIGARELYANYEEHIKFFYQARNYIQKPVFSKKIVALGINGHWDADAINLLQSKIVLFVLENPNEVVKSLKQFDEKEIKSFWHFVVDNPHPKDPENVLRYDHIYDEIRKIDLNQANILKVQYDAVISNSDH